MSGRKSSKVRGDVALPDAERWAPIAFARIGLNARLVRTKCHAMTSYSDLRDGGGRLRNRVERVRRRAFRIAREKRRSHPKSACCAERPKRRRESPLRKSPRRSPPRSVISQAKRRIFPGVRLDLGDQDPLFAQIYEAARRIGWGRTTTYGAFAKDIGAGPEVARDVGTAMAKNPVPLIVPCHRVLAAGGKMGGFSGPAERRRKSACWSSRAFASRRPRRFSGPSRSEGASKHPRL